MLSICIPVYNYKIEGLLIGLNLLIEKLNIPLEIIIVDDCSGKNINDENKKIAGVYGYRFIELKKNIGRSAIRNFLGREAIYSNLLFLDCDSEIISNNFLNNYLPYLDKKVVVYGGRIYQAKPPERKYLLHWKYGIKREVQPVSVRNIFPTRYFNSNNFLVNKEILLKFSFNEKLREYGHEDTFFAMELYQNEIPIVHIDNPVLHAGLETNENFLLKTKAGIKNLCIIENELNDNNVLQMHVNPLKAFSKIKRLNLISVIKFFWSVTRPILILLINKFYLMKALDVYKIGFLCFIYKKSTAQPNDASSLKIL